MSRTLGHRETGAATACPGDHLQAELRHHYPVDPREEEEEAMLNDKLLRLNGQPKIFKVFNAGVTGGVDARELTMAEFIRLDALGLIIKDDMVNAHQEMEDAWQAAFSAHGEDITALLVQSRFLQEIVVNHESRMRELESAVATGNSLVVGAEMIAENTRKIAELKDAINAQAARIKEAADALVGRGDA